MSYNRIVIVFVIALLAVAGLLGAPLYFGGTAETTAVTSRVTHTNLSNGWTKVSTFDNGKDPAANIDIEKRCDGKTMVYLMLVNQDQGEMSTVSNSPECPH